ncbi:MULTISPECIES: methylmalonyl-CoA mutase family protein [unclassified Imperialibacter]|uniref:methylmalonyl-CoA mutase family protein n=1 Tax=unclassified Imperialibacter TaxID=2629706 RepID=UPI001255C060|nr:MULTISPECIES: methylmalonyl-CoA mutase family protein [unclassified Imperialibacter]CAD5273186.1 putative Methylmalonyl-CoA mutase [Imperialibacter sp. 89]CAD5288857.1 putative Methylmalonyl-CoA mutase [Imperialibacter sp. 75]VVT14421.1 putative Methylmalonyl-CoA mutase [Imperialibacter sp. EC-SDR9]
MSKWDMSNFPPSNHSLWKENALKELKPKQLDSLQWHYDPDVIIQPYYEKTDAFFSLAGNANAELLPDQQMGRLWHYLDSITIDTQVADNKDANEIALESLGQGADGILWKLKEIDQSAHVTLFKDIAFEYCQNAFQVYQWGEAEEAFFQRFFSGSFLKKDILPGFLFYDPVSDSDEILRIEALFPQGKSFRPHCFDATSELTSSLSPTGQIAYLLLAFIERCKKLSSAGVSIDSIVDRTIVCVSIGRDFFHEMAKIKAIKVVLSQAANHFDGSKVSPADIKIYSQPNVNTHSVVDPYVNLIRMTSAAMAGVNGGASYLSMPGFDSRNPFSLGQFSRRISRNISNLLRDESYFDKNCDPMAGSYFLEKLSEELASEGWTKMQKIESSGGFSSSLAGGYWQNEANKFQEKERALIASRKLNVVGVNNFCDLSLFESFPTLKRYNGDGSLLSSFERLRIKMEGYLAKQSGQSRPAAMAVFFGDKQASLARYNFVKGVLPAAGIDVAEWVPWSPQHSAPFSADTRLIIACSSDQDYIESGPSVFQALKEQCPDAHIVLAGNPADNKEQLTKAGIDSFIHLKSDFVKTLSSYQKLFGI